MKAIVVLDYSLNEEGHSVIGKIICFCPLKNFLNAGLNKVNIELKGERGIYILEIQDTLGVKSFFKVVMK